MLEYTICKKHKTYKAIHRPKCSCLDCWMIWLKKNPEETIKADDLQKVVNSCVEKFFSEQDH